VASDSLDTRTLLLLLVAALVLLPLLTMGMGSGMMGGPMMGGGTWGGGMWDGGTAPGWWLLVGLLGRVLTLLVVLGVGYLLYRALTESGGETDEAMETVRLAYARGDIDDEEYERRRKTLERDES
jgi:putative membrane protein